MNQARLLRRSRLCYNPKKYAHHGLDSEVRIYRKIGNDDSGQLCDAPMKKFCAYNSLGDPCWAGGLSGLLFGLKDTAVRG